MKGRGDREDMSNDRGKTRRRLHSYSTRRHGCACVRCLRNSWWICCLTAHTDWCLLWWQPWTEITCTLAQRELHIIAISLCASMFVCVLESGQASVLLPPGGHLNHHGRTDERQASWWKIIQGVHNAALMHLVMAISLVCLSHVNVVLGRTYSHSLKIGQIN